MSSTVKVKEESRICFGNQKDRCPNCRAHLKARNFTIVWKDVLECGVCGNMWIADARELKKLEKAID